MNDEIKVGDRVWASGLGDGRMLAIHDDYGWVLWNTHDHCTARLDSLTRIEPEPVTLTPKFKMGQEVLCDGLGISTINGVFVGYTVKEHGGIWLNGDLEAVPEPCEK